MAFQGYTPRWKRQRGDTVTLRLTSSEPLKGKPVVLFFWPLDFTFVCPTEIIAFSERAKEFEDLGVQILGVSIDSHFSHLAWRNTPRNEGGIGEIAYPLVADLNKQIAKDYDVLLDAGADPIERRRVEDGEDDGRSPRKGARTHSRAGRSHAGRVRDLGEGFDA